MRPDWPPGSSSTTWPVRTTGTVMATRGRAPVEPTRPRVVTPLGSSGFSSWARTTRAPPAISSRATAAVTTDFSAMSTPPVRSEGSLRSLDRGTGDSGDELVEEDVVENRDRDPDEKSPGHQRAPEVDVAPDQLRRHPE